MNRAAGIMRAVFRLLRRRFDRTVALAALGLALCGALAAFGYWYFSAPNQLTVAVGPPDSSEARLVGAFAQALVESRRDIRLRVRTTRDLHESAQALQQKAVDLAVIRPDVDLPANARAVAILRVDAVIFLASGADKPDDIAKLVKKRLGLVNRDEADMPPLKTILEHYNLAGDEITLLPLAATEVETAIAGKRIDALAFVAPVASREAADIARAAARAWNGRVTLIPIAHAQALAAKSPVLSDETLAPGTLLGRPQLPDEETKTIGVSYRLVSRPEVDRTVISRVAQHLFQLRTHIAGTAPGIHLMKAPDTDESTTAALPNHLGANDYFHREQRTFMDDYGDWIWIALFAGGGLSSGLVWAGQLFRRTRRELVDRVIDRLLAILAEARKAESTDQLEKLSAEIDTLVSQAIRHGRRRTTTTRAMSAMILALDTARSAVAERRRELYEAERFHDATLEPAHTVHSAAVVDDTVAGNDD
jgi:TRAP-type uncharacterized transport system substrate-binding protein